MKAIQLLLNSQLPEDLRDYGRTMDKKSIGRLLADVAAKYPDRYESIAKAITDIGRKASYLQGETLTLADTEPVFDRQAVFDRMDAEIEAARQALASDDFEQAKLDIWNRYTEEITELTKKEAMARGSNLANTVISGARGNPSQLRMMISTPAMYADSKDEPVPIFVRRSFGDGVRPAEYLASTYGARKSVLSTKRATARGGDLSKQMVQSTTPLIITTDDCGVGNGIDLDIDDDSLRGRVLAEDYGPIKAGTVLDRQALNNLRNKQGIKKLVVRSALTCDAEEGLCARCMGVGADGKFPEIGEAVGITASQAIGEPIAQGALNQKHTGGAASGSGKRIYSGFDVINRFVQSPEEFPERAAVARKDGVVTKVEEAPQGGHYVHVGGESYYVPPDHPVLVKKGDELEAGDPISEGIVDASDIVDLRGIGEGRRYYADRLKQILDDSGMAPDRRNVEVLARGALDHVQVYNPDDDVDLLPDDIISYNQFSRIYNPPEDTKREPIKSAIGKYLQQPVLHYTIGTRITPKVAKRLEEVGRKDAYVSPTEPNFGASMVRLRTAAHAQRDWLASMHTSYLKKNLAEAAIRGDDTNVLENTHFAPRLAYGEGFGKHIKETGKF